MKLTTVFLMTFLISSHAHSQANTESCISANCDLYKIFKAELDEKLKKINCSSLSDSSSQCNQIELAKLVTEYVGKVKSTFSTTTANQNLVSDIHYNSKLNAFTAKTQSASGYYELVPVLSNPNLGVHWGKVVNNQADVDRLVNIDPNSPDVKTNNWYLTQWKKDTPLMLSEQRKDPIITTSNYVDQYLGKPKFEINSPVGKFGTETSLLIYKNPQDESNVFEIVGRNGWLNNVGGSNVFLSSPITNIDKGTFTSDISLSFNGKISRMNTNKYQEGNPHVIGFGFAAFTAYNSASKTSMFIQISFADTRGQNSPYRGCYMHGDNIEIVYTYNSDNDFVGTASDPSSPLQPKKYNLNKYLCEALSQNYSCPKDFKAPDFPGLRNNLKNWTITGFYTGVETQASKATNVDQSKPGPIEGEVELGFQYSNMRVMANSNINFNNCNDVANAPVTPVSPAVPIIPENKECSKGNFTANGKQIEFYCGSCGEIDDGVKQADGCYHKVVGDAPVTPPPAPAVTTPGTCSTGVFDGANGVKIQFSCGCGDVPGGVLQADGCYHKPVEVQSRIETTTPTLLEKTSGTFCANSQLVKWICNAGPIEGYSDVGGGCYHLTTRETCVE